MVQREMQSRYAGSALGVLWAYIQPLLTVAVYFLVFDVVFAMRLGSDAPVQRMGTYLVVGALPWLAFSDGVSRGAASIIEAANVLQKNALSPTLFVLRSILASWLAFMPIMVVMAALYVFLTGHWQTLWVLPVLLLIQLGLMYVSAHILALFTAATRDTTQILSFALGIGIYLSPVLFPLSLFPVQWQWVLFINPMSSLVLAYQQVMLEGLVPSGYLWCIMAVWLIALTLVLNALKANSHDELVDWL